MSSQKTDPFKRPSFDQPFSPITNRKRRGPSVTFAEGTKSPNSPARTPKRFVDIRSFCQGPNVAFAIKSPNSPAVPYANSPKRFSKSNGGATENSHPLEETSRIHNSAVGTSEASLEPALVTSTSNEHSKFNNGNFQNSPKCFLEDSGDITSDKIYLLGLTPNIHNGASSTTAFLKSALITSTPNELSSLGQSSNDQTLVTNVPNPANPPNRSAEDSEDVTLDSQHSWLPQSQTPDTRVAVWTYDARALREANKNLRQIYQDEGLSYGKDVSAAELKSRMSRAVKLRQASVAKMFKLLYASRDVQLCFLVDVTGSMDRHIKGVRDSIFKIVEKLLEKHVSCAGHSAIAKKVSLAFVGYRDFLKTGKNSKNHFELLPFTEKAESFREFCRKIHATGGGGDRAEDVFGGLEKAISNLRWDDASMGTKVIFHIGDHPCHGKEYQTAEYIATKSDNFPDGDPGGRTVEELFSDLREKGIQYHFGRIDWCTDRMIELFSEAAGYEIVVFDSKNVNTLVDNVVSSVSIGTSIRPGMRPKPRIKTDKTIPNWSELPTFTGIFLSYHMPGSIDDVISGKPLRKKTTSKAKIQVAESPFDHGGERKAFYGLDVTANTPTDIVLKEYIEKNNSAVPYEIASQTQTTAMYLASIFNIHLPEYEIGYFIKFLKVYVLAIEIEPGEQNRYLSCERRYGSDRKYLRFSDNYDYEMHESTCKLNDLKVEDVELLMAFSHWTYEVSHGYLMVVDLQGVIGSDESGCKTLELTDPAINCTDLTRFGRTNAGPEGMKTFFEVHKCNKFCTAMELKTITQA